jgi:LuxR family transcriptional regulator, maltose regulon positive regulatory protein
LSDFAKTGGRTIRVMEILLLQAIAWQARGDRERALDCLDRALNIPRHGNYYRLFLDEGQPMAELLQHAASHKIHSHEVNHLLAAFGVLERKSALVQPLIEPLSLGNSKKIRSHIVGCVTPKDNAPTYS